MSIDGTSATPPPGTLAARLDAARERNFVGRMHEIELFRDAITAPEPPFGVMFIHGPGGVGKSALLTRLRREAARCDVPCFLVNGHGVETSPEAFEATIRATGLLKPAGRRAVLMLDTYEVLGALDDWIRDVFLPGLPADLLVVIAGRDAPSLPWREDSGWSELLQPVPLRNLREEESAALLSQRAVPGQLHADIHARTHGHPLALALLADMIAAGDLHEASELHALPPSVVGALVDRLLRDTSSEAQRAVLEVSAHVRVVTVDLLLSLHGDDEGSRLFDWLRELSFITETSEGLVMHDLVCELIDEDLKWRDRERYRALHRSVRQHYFDVFWRASEAERPRAFREVLYLHRKNPVFRPFYTWSPHGLRTEGARHTDCATILEIIEQHEGAASAAIAAYWFERRPQDFQVYRDRGNEIRGLAAALRLSSVSEEDIAADPCVAAVFKYINQAAPLRPGDELIVDRFWMDRDAYQSVTPVYELISISSSVEWLTNPRLAWCGVFTRDPEFWGPMAAYIDFFPVPDLTFEVGGRTYSGFAHDWRTRPIDAWLDLMGDRELNDEIDVTALAPAPESQIVVLSEPDFEAAVRELLRHYHRPDQLAESPLLRSRVAIDAAGGGDPTPATLSALVREAAEELRDHPRDHRLFRVLDATYFHPAQTQEAAAERLDLPFSTYRRHLSSGIARVVATLWQRELHGAGPALRARKN